MRWNDGEGNANVSGYGGIRIDTVQGDIDAKSKSGYLSLQGVRGAVSALTQSGDITVRKG